MAMSKDQRGRVEGHEGAVWGGLCVDGRCKGVTVECGAGSWRHAGVEGGRIGAKAEAGEAVRHEGSLADHEHDAHKEIV